MGKLCLLGVDVGTSAVKVFAAGIGKKGFDEIIGSGIVPSAGLVKGDIVDAPALVFAVRQAIDCVLMVVDISIDRAVLGLGGNPLRSYNGIGSIATISPELIQKEDVVRACRAATLTAVPDDHCLLQVIPTAFWVDGEKEDVEPTGRKGKRLEVEAHIVSMPQEIANQLKFLFSDTGITLSGIYSNAIVGSMNVAAPPTDSYIYIDMGAGVTDLVVCHHKQIRLSASLPLGGDYITGDIMHALSIGRAHAEEIKRYYSKLDKKSLRGKNVVLDCNDYGTMDKKVAFDFLHDVVESRVEELVTLIHHYLSPVLSGFPPAQVYLTGGSALMPSIPETFERVLKLPIHIVTPSVAREYSYLGNTACIGLLKYSASDIILQDSVTSTRPGIFAKIRDLFRA